MIFIVIPVFNRLHFTKACLESLSNQTYEHFRTVIVDHGSNDGTWQYIEQNFSQVTLLKGESTMWWTAATNLGIRYALGQGASHILTLNNDTLVQPDFIQNLIDLSTEESGQLIGASAYNATTDTLCFAGERFSWEKGKELKFPLSEKEFTNYCTHFPGRGLLIPKEVFETIGTFDEHKFPHYMADYDFSYRAYASGYKIICSDKLKVLIYPDASGSNQMLKTRSLKGYFMHLFNIKGAGNLHNYFYFCWQNRPNILSFVSAFVIGTSRRLLSYWKY